MSSPRERKNPPRTRKAYKDGLLPDSIEVIDELLGLRRLPATIDALKQQKGAATGHFFLSAAKKIVKRLI